MRAFIILILCLTALPASAVEALWDRLRSQPHVVMIRHALAPGTGDPADFDVNRCDTQRNLSSEGRDQARIIAERFRAEAIPVTKVLSSAWCRCVDTAQLAFGDASVWPPLNSFFRDRSTEPDQTAAVRRRVAEWAGPGVMVLVTHQVNISALTGTFARSGEAVVLRPDGEEGFEQLGTLKF